MKVLHILTPDDLLFDAPNLIQSLQLQGIDQCVAAPDTAPYYPDLLKAGIHTAPHIFTRSFVPLQKILTRFLIAREKPDIVQVWTRQGARLVGKPKIQAMKIIGLLDSKRDPAQYGSCAHLVGVTKDISEHIVKKGFPAACAHHIPPYPEIIAQPPIDRASLATPREAKVLLSLSRLHPRKGLDTLFAAMQNLPDCIAWLAGEGPQRRELETLAQTFGIIDRVRFLGKRNDHAALLRAADVCVLPSRVEPYGTIIIEAWASGTPLVASSSLAATAHIAHESSGLLTPIENVSALIASVRRALDDEPLRRRMVANGYAAYIKDHTRESVTRQWIEFYKSL